MSISYFFKYDWRPLFLCHILLGWSLWPTDCSPCIPSVSFRERRFLELSPTLYFSLYSYSHLLSGGSASPLLFFFIRSGQLKSRALNICCTSEERCLTRLGCEFVFLKLNSLMIFLLGASTGDFIRAFIRAFVKLGSSVSAVLNCSFITFLGCLCKLPLLAGYLSPIEF